MMPDSFEGMGGALSCLRGLCYHHGATVPDDFRPFDFGLWQKLRGGCAGCGCDTL